MAESGRVVDAFYDAADKTSDCLAEVADAVRPLLRGWLHLVMFPLVVVFGMILIVGAQSFPGRISVIIYTATSALLFGTSALYHRGKWSPKAHLWLKRMDHSNIYLCIAGTYTPFAVLALEGTAQTAILVGVWAGALLGVIFRMGWPDAPRWLYTPLYVLLGWAAIFVLPELSKGAGGTALALTILGGVIYTVGGIIYGLKRPNTWPQVWAFHEYFHAATVLAWLSQYAAVSVVVF